MAQYLETQLFQNPGSAKDSKPCPKVDSTLEFGMRTDAGRVRENNEDFFLVAPELNLFVVSDGMGGLASGEVASRLTVDAIFEHCSEADGNPSLPLIGNIVEGVSTASNRLASSVRLANKVVHQEAHKNGEHRAMGATVAAIRFFDGRVSLAHVGDSRIYRLREDQLEQLTQDHSFIAEQVRRGAMNEHDARKSNLQNVLLRAIGVDPEVQVDINEELVIDGDILLLCSDGLTREVSEAEIATVLRNAKCAQEIADRLVTLATEAGGRDNITVIAIRKAPRSLAAFAHIGRLGKWFCGFGDQSRRGGR